jgi:phosphate transport system substrate-binding protein
MMNKILALICLFFATTNYANAREYIRAVGSSSVYPFVTLVAEEFGREMETRTPIIESTGTGGGFKLFCGGIGDRFPDIVNASRKIKQSEKKLCSRNNIEDIKEIIIGYDGIVVAHNSENNSLNFSSRDLFLALSKFVPKNGILVPNYYTRWDEIDKHLPHNKIAVYGPPTTSGTRDAFIETVMEKECIKFKEFDKHHDMCKLIREDGNYIDVGENDNLIMQKLSRDLSSFGILPYSLFENYRKILQPASINHKLPSEKSIRDNSYILSRILYVYFKEDHKKLIKDLDNFQQYLMRDDIIRKDGLLSSKGLITLD